MTELRDIVARGLREAGLTAVKPWTIDAIVKELEAHADEVRVHMEMQVWGMVR